ncbi:MAG: ATP-dependent RNA helicase HrpA [Phycisphaerales bacterium]|nr:ATP-dependent RNA helicase HrpA [Phycisphaerales bacterium]
MSSPLPTPDDLRRRIDQSMLIDRRAFRSRLGTLQHEADKSGPAAVAARIAQLAADIDASAARAEQRAKNAPAPAFANDLPITQRRDQIAAAIRDHQVSVVCGETGSGKTTQLPQICLALGRGRFGMIGHTQPRRIAARAVAQRIAEELGTTIAPKSPVGFKVRFGDQTGEATLVKLMTDGVLLAEASHDRDLLAYDTIIIDEAHERSLNIDFLLGYLKQLLPRRPDLKVIITSATIDPQRLSNHFGGPKAAPVIEVSGRTYPVEVRYHQVPDVDADDFEQNEEEALLQAVDELTTSGLPRGDILAFFPGEREIRLASELLRKTYHTQFEILPLYARLSPQDQQRVFSPTKNGPTRIVLATNVAETSLTVPGIRYVIDTGLARISRYSHRTKVQRLPIEAISQASANQRSGRCGRVAAGVAVRLYTEEDFNSRPAFTEPEILRTNLASVILQMKSLRLGAVEDFPFVERPDSRMIKDGYDTLHELGALTEQGDLTEIGRSLARLPLDPKLGRIIIAAEDEGGQGCLTEVLPIAAALSVQDPRDRPMEKAQAADQAQAQFKHETSDFITLLNIWEWWNKARDQGTWNQVKKGCHDRFLSFNRMREWEETHNQLRRLCEELDFAFNDPKTKPAGDDAVHKALLPGLLSNILLKNEAAGAQTGEYKGARAITAHIFPGSTLFKKGGRWLVAAELVQTTRLYARTLARVQPEWIEHAAAHLIKRSFSDPHFHAESGRVMAWERATLHGLPLITRRRADYGKINPAEARDIFIYDALVNHSYVPPYAGSAAPDTPDGWFTHNTRILEDAARIEAKLRRHDLIAEKNALHNFFDTRIDKPSDGKPAITSTHQFEGWRKDASRKDPKVLHMSLEQILPEGTAEEADDTLYPDYIPLGQSLGLLDYHLAPGKEKDGITLNVPIETLTALDQTAAEWLVPGMVQDKVHALLKALPKQYRTQFVGQKTESTGAGETGLAALAAELTAHLTFQDGHLPAALSAAADQLRSVAVPPDAWPLRGIPDHLRLNIRVLDEHGNTLGESRDIDELKKKLAARARRSLSSLARQEFGKEGLTSWSWGDDQLLESVEIDRAGSTVVGYPCIQDQGDTVALTLADSPESAHRLTRRGLIRLFALQCKDEVVARLRSLPDGGADAMYRHYGAIGDPSELKRDLVDLVCEQTFLTPSLGAQPATKNDFDARLQAQWGRLGGNTITIGKLVATVLANRHRVAHKLASGYPKQWETSIADLREHAAWLLPPGVFHCVPLDRLQHYPRYTEGMWRRLERLREGGTAKEAQTFPQVTAAWKRLTHWVHTHHAEARKQEEELLGGTPRGGTPLRGVSEEASTTPPRSAGPPTPKPRNVLPQAQGQKRSRVVIATDAAAWAMQSIADAAMPPAVEQYRWLLEEFRVSAFAQELGTTQPVSAKRLDEAWTKVE